MGLIGENYAAALGPDELRQRIQSYRIIGMDKMARRYEAHLLMKCRKKG